MIDEIKVEFPPWPIRFWLWLTRGITMIASAIGAHMAYRVLRRR